MCGIAGFIGNGTIPPERLEATLRLMKRRGPDHQEWRSWNLEDGRTLYLLHSRLSIIDLDHRADQPLRVGKKWIVFNGELYNYKEVRAKLIGEGHEFATRSDTEVLLSALDAWGPDGLDQCEGMWAFAVFDEADETLLLGRDRFGEKPLYLHRAPQGLFFGSEIKFLSYLADTRFAVNQNQVFRYLVNGYKSLFKNSETFFNGIEELPAGHQMVLGSGNSEDRAPYWTFNHQPDESLTFADAVERSRELLIDSVKLRLRSDVPLAFCMSGGIDSNALISIAKRIFNYDVHGFTIVNDDERYDEQELVNLAVDELSIRHTAIPVQTKNFLGQMRRLVRQHDAPVFTITYYAHWLLERAIAEHGYKISISGTAADEIFSGYFDHHLLYMNTLENDPAALKKAVDNWTSHIKPIVRNPLLQNPMAFIENPDQRDHIFLGADVFSGFLAVDWGEAFAEENYTGSLMRNRMLNELFHEVVPPILHEGDHNAMYFSIEDRSPFLDRRLFEFSLTIPTRHLIQDGAAKAVLREAIRGIAPDPIVDNRHKVGFNAPIFSFLDVTDPQTRAQLLDDSPIFEYVRKDKIETLLAADYLPNSWSKFLFYFLSSKMFLEEFAS